MVKSKNTYICKAVSILSVVVILAAFISFSPITVKAAAYSDNLQMGEFLTTGQRITSANGLYFAIMQSDGNFVIYNNNSQALWHTQTPGHNYYDNKAFMQTDGNFVIYGINYSGTMTVLYNADCYHQGAGNYELKMRNDSVLEVTRNGNRVWASTNPAITSDPYGDLGWQWIFRGINPYKNINQRYSSTHLGIDSNASANTAIYSTTSGTVLSQGEGWNDSMGWFVSVKANVTCNGNTLTSRYMHMNARSAFRENNSVTSSSLIGYVGTTGDSTGNHLHMDVNTINTQWGNNLTTENTINPERLFPNIAFTYNS